MCKLCNVYINDLFHENRLPFDIEEGKKLKQKKLHTLTYTTEAIECCGKVKVVLSCVKS